MSMTKLEEVLAKSLADVTKVDIGAIIDAARATCPDGVSTVAAGSMKVVVTGVGAEQEVGRTKRASKAVQETPTSVSSQQPAKTEPPSTATTIPPPVEPPVQQTVAQTNTTQPQGGINLTGLFTGSGADKKIVKEVFLAAVGKATNLAQLIALNATCDCGFPTGDYTEETAAVLKRKLTRWGDAQE